MVDLKDIELFCLKAAVLESVANELQSDALPEMRDPDTLASLRFQNVNIEQFDSKSRQAAIEMAEHYKIFYLLENDIRRLIGETLRENHGDQWWDKVVPENVKKDVSDNIAREDKAAISRRSTSMLDYTTFGQLGDIIRTNWDDFAGMLSNQNALGRVLFQLNLSRGAIAHCGVLEQDEVDRLYLSIKDWFRVFAGPAAR